MTKSYAVFAIMGALWLTGCGPDGVDGNGDRVDETRDAVPFSRIRSDAALDVWLTQGGEQSVVVSIDSNLQQLVTTRVDNDTLYVDQTKDIGEVVDGPHVVITVPQLTHAELAGSGNVALAFEQPTLPLDLYLNGSGSMHFKGTTAALGAYLNGSGDIRLEGTTSDLDMNLSGSGSIRGQGLGSDSAVIDLSGSGDISATVQDSVRASLSGSGRIDLYGNAAVESASNSGSGDIVRH